MEKFSKWSTRFLNVKGRFTFILIVLGSTRGGSSLFFPFLLQPFSLSVVFCVFFFQVTFALPVFYVVAERCEINGLK